MGENAIWGIVFILSGLFSITGAVMDWDWFVNSRRAWLFRTLFGRFGARVIYVLLGLVFVVLGLATMISG